MSDQPTLKLTIVIPDDMSFSSLKLQYDSAGRGLTMDWEPIRRICEVNGIEFSLMISHDENWAQLIKQWYVQHLANGGARDAVYDTIIAIGHAQRSRGGGFSYPPGQA
jgi:hypothetical protein